MNDASIRDLLDNYVNIPTHFAHANGVTVTHIDHQHGVGVLQVGETSYNPGKTVHGGALLTLADTVSGCFVAACGDSTCVTTNATMEFLRPANGPTITCTATPKKMGRRISVVAVTLTDIAGKTVATGTYTFLRMEERPLPTDS